MHSFFFSRQFITVWLIATEAPAHVGVPETADTPLRICDPTWWYYQWWLAADEERNAMADIWLATDTRSWFWR